MPKKRNWPVFLLKCAVSLSIIVWFLTQKTSLGEIFREIGSASPWWLGAAFSLHAVGLLISAVRWRILIRAQGDSVPLGFLAGSYLVGMFFNMFLPSRIGGDVVRIWDGSKYSKSLLKSSAIVVVERLTGVIALFLFAFGASLIRLEMAKDMPIIWLALGLGALGLLSVVFFLLPPAGRLLERIPEKGIAGRFKHKALSFRETILHYREKKQALFKAFLLAVLLQVNVVTYYFLIGKAVNLNIPLVDYFIFIPIVHLVLLIPVTINGLGLRELSFSRIFGYYGLAAAAAVSFAWIDLGFMIIVGLIGGVVFMVRRR